MKNVLHWREIGELRPVAFAFFFSHVKYLHIIND